MDKVSLLMMTYNCKKQLEKTLTSVERQDYLNIEVVIRDAGSTDGTIDIIKLYREKHHMNINYVSEPDDGLYDALNKAVHMATGKYLLVCNDELVDNSAISKLVNATEKSGLDGAHADLIYVDDDKVKRYWHMGKGTIYTGWLPGHPTMLIKKKVYEELGDYDISYHIAADYEYMIRMFVNGVRLEYVPEVLVRMYYGGTSTGGLQDYVLSFKEGCRALRANGVHGGIWISGLRSMRVILQFLNCGKAEIEWKKKS